MFVCVCVYVCVAAGVESTVEADRVPLSRNACDAHMSTVRYGNFRNVGMQTLHTVTQAPTDTRAHTLVQEIRRRSGHTRRQISRFHAGLCHAFILTAQEYKVTYREVHGCRNALNTNSMYTHFY